MVTAIRESLGMARDTAKERDRTRTAATMLANTKKISHQEKAFTSGKMVRAMKENGRTGFSMVKESRSCQMEQSLTETGIWDCREALACVSTQMEVNMTEIGSMVNLTGLEKRLYQMEQHTKEDGLKVRQEDTVSRYFQTAPFSKGNGKSQSFLKESASFLTDKSLTVNGLMANLKALGSSPGLMVVDMKANGSRASQLVKV